MKVINQKLYFDISAVSTMSFESKRKKEEVGSRMSA